MANFVKKVIKTGTHKPNEHDRVIVRVSMTIGVVVVIQNETVAFDVGHAEDFNVIKILDEVVQTMGLDELCEVTTSPRDGLSDMELTALGVKDCIMDELQITVHLQDIQKLAEFWEMSETEKVLVAQIMKRRGNKLLNLGLLSRALLCYKKAIKILQGSVSVMDGENNSCLLVSEDKPCELLAICLTNAATCLFQFVSKHERTENPSLKKNRSNYLLSCVNCCNRATKLRPQYTKAWFRLAKAYAALKNYEQAAESAEQCCSCLLAKNPRDQSVNKVATIDPGCAGSVEHLGSLISHWRMLAANQEKTERETIRQRTLKAYADTWLDDDDESEKLPISVWSNELAENMMSLHEELEAFGEKMPELNTTRGKYKAKLASIQDLETDDDNI